MVGLPLTEWADAALDWIDHYVVPPILLLLFVLNIILVGVLLLALAQVLTVQLGRAR